LLRLQGKEGKHKKNSNGQQKNEWGGGKFASGERTGKPEKTFLTVFQKGKKKIKTEAGGTREKGGVGGGEGGPEKKTGGENKLKQKGPSLLRKTHHGKKKQGTEKEGCLFLYREGHN